MTIAAGTKLGSYEVAALIGAGGMGEVYRAHDIKLGRDVAIKVLPEAFAHDAERLSRFQREAKMLAALNHPNIATIHGLEQSGSTHYLVMELVSGETLAERVKQDGAVSIEEALAIAKQIAEALECAHEKGIIHRDLKPANVKVTPEGKVKVLDFGLAKAFAGDATTEDMGNSPTLSMAATMQGVILGTAAYMSPEQAKGKAVDKRTDIWSFGAVLYELLTGKQAFHGEDVGDILASVVMKEPAFDALPANISSSIRVLLQRCLRKDRRQRTPDAAILRIEIEDAIAAPKDSGTTRTPASMVKLLVAVGAVAAALAIIALVALWGWWRATRPVERPLVRLEVDLGPDVSLSSITGSGTILSPDGTRLLYVSQGRLFTRRLDQPKATELVGTQGASAPFFSPDGQWVAFFSLGKLKKISVDGGASVSLCDAPNSRGGSWGGDGTILFASDSRVALSKVSSGGGTPQPVGTLDNQGGELTQRWPQVLPGSKAVLFTSSMHGYNYDDADIVVYSMASGQRKIVQRGGSYGRYLPSGHLIYVNRGTVFAVRFDLDRLEVRGTPVPVLEQVGYGPTGSAVVDFSQTGTLIYGTDAGAGGLFTVQWLDAAGKTQPLLAKPDSYQHPSLSPDGTRLAISTTDIWVYEWQRDTMTRLTFGPAPSTFPIWSPEGRYILFQSLGRIFWTRSDGSGKPQPLTQSKNYQIPWSFTSDGKRLAFMEFPPETRSESDLWTVALESDGAGLRAGKPEPYLQTPFDERLPAFSPDGRWMAYSSNDSGLYQVYVRAFPDKGGKWQISNSGGLHPIWSRSGHELFFRTQENQIMVASYTVKNESFIADKPRLWSEKKIADVGIVANYDLAPDGKRIAALMPAETAEAQKAQNHVIFLENFFDEVRRRTGTQAK